MQATSGTRRSRPERQSADSGYAHSPSTRSSGIYPNSQSSSLSSFKPSEYSSESSSTFRVGMTTPPKKRMHGKTPFSSTSFTHVSESQEQEDPLTPNSRKQLTLMNQQTEEDEKMEEEVDAEFTFTHTSDWKKADEVVVTPSNIVYDSSIRLQLNNHESMRLETIDSDSDEAVLNGTGNGVDTEDQTFEFLNVDRISLSGPVQYGDVVGIQCTSGRWKGYVLRVDNVDRTCGVKKGPVCGRLERWLVVHPDSTPEAYGTRSNQQNQIFYFGQEDASAALKRPVETGDKICLVSLANDLYLSAIPDADGNVAIKLVSKDDPLEPAVQAWQVAQKNLPYEPNWNRQRPYLTGSFMVESDEKREQNRTASDVNKSPLTRLPTPAQETSVMDDLLCALKGIEGKFILLRVWEDQSKRYEFYMDKHKMDQSIASMASRCLPLGSYYITLKLFVEQQSRYEYGHVNHAFCAALKVLLKEYMVVVGQLERQHMKQSSFGLQQMWHCLQPSLLTMQKLSVLATKCQSLTGGAILSQIQRIKSSLAGDEASNRAFHFLLVRSSVPYLEMVEEWIYTGKLADPYDEFMVQSDENLGIDDLQRNMNSTYWTSRFVLREEETPLFLQRSQKKILDAGKYLNIFRSCGRSIECPSRSPLSLSNETSTLDTAIDKAHKFASERLLQLFMDEYDLKKRLESLNHYFFMDHGDFYVDFLNVAEVELKSKAADVPVGRLESLLQLSLQTSSCANDRYKEDMTCFLSRRGMVQQLEVIHASNKEKSEVVPEPALDRAGYKVIDAFTLDYKVSWPLSLLLSFSALSKYQLVFRHLFFCKHVEHQLSEAWLNHQAIKELRLRGVMTQSFLLRHRMLHFVQNFVYYMTYEVISPRWHELQTRLHSVETVDDVMVALEYFLDMVMKECLLSHADLLRAVAQVMNMCVHFAGRIESVVGPYIMDEETIKNEREDQRMRRAEKKAEQDADRLLKRHTKTFVKKGANLRRRPSSQVDLRKQRIKELETDMKSALNPPEEGQVNPYVKMTKENEAEFDARLDKLMKMLARKSKSEADAHLSNLVRRLDYNGFYADLQKQ